MYGKKRGSIQITIPISDETLATARLNLSSGDEYRLSATETIIPETDITNLIFESDNNVSFSFSVAANGEHPEIRDVLLNEKEGDILIRKHSNRVPVYPIVGTYVCEECGTHPTLNNSITQTFNIIRQEEMVNLDARDDLPPPPGPRSMAVQVALGNNVFMGTGEENGVDPFPTGNTFTTLIDGEIAINNNAIFEWSGSHTFSNFNSDLPDYSAASGQWHFNSPVYAELSGMFIRDIDCFSP